MQKLFLVITGLKKKTFNLMVPFMNSTASLVLIEGQTKVADMHISQLIMLRATKA